MQWRKRPTGVKSGFGDPLKYLISRTAPLDQYMAPRLRIQIDDLSGKAIADFLEEHIEEMKAVSPPESKHALDLDSLRKPQITFWTVHIDASLVGCGALKELCQQHGEIKSMRSAKSQRGKGIASTLLKHIIQEARTRNYTRLSLETGSMPFFEPARCLYRKFGFKSCQPFSNYKKDANSVFMTLHLRP